MRVKYILTLVLFIVAQQVSGQEWLRAKLFEHGKQVQVIDMCESEDGSLYLAMEFTTYTFNLSPLIKIYNQGKTDIAIVKLNKNFDVQWVKQFGSSDDESVTGIEYHQQHGIHVQGFFTNAEMFEGHAGNSTNETNMFLMQLNDSGNINWVRTFEPEQRQNNLELFKGKAICLSDQILLSGSFRPEKYSFFMINGEEFKSESTVCTFISSYDYDGTVSWTKVIEGATTVDLKTKGNSAVLLLNGPSIKIDEDRWSSQYAGIGFYFVQFNSTDGSVNWVNGIFSEQGGHISRIEFSFDVQGSIYSSALFFNYIHADSMSFSLPGKNSYVSAVIKLASNGKVRWMKGIGLEQSSIYVRDIEVVKSDQIYISIDLPSTSIQYDDSTYNTGSGSTSSGCVLEIDNKGELTSLWKPGLNMLMLQSSARDNYLLVSGYSPKKDFTYSNGPAFQFNEQINGHHIVGKVGYDALSTPNPSHSNDQISIYPNPAQEVINLEVPGYLDNGTVEIINLHGQLMMSTEFRSVELPSINVANIAKGVYTLRISGSNHVFCKTLLVE